MRGLLPVAVSPLAGAVIARCDPQRCDTASKRPVGAVPIAARHRTSRGGCHAFSPDRGSHYLHCRCNLCFWAIDKFVNDGRLSNLLKLLVVLICLAAILRLVLPLAGINWL